MQIESVKPTTKEKNGMKIDLFEALNNKKGSNQMKKSNPFEVMLLKDDTGTSLSLVKSKTEKGEEKGVQKLEKKKNKIEETIVMVTEKQINIPSLMEGLLGNVKKQDLLSAEVKKIDFVLPKKVEGELDDLSLMTIKDVLKSINEPSKKEEKMIDQLMSLNSGIKTINNEGLSEQSEKGMEMIEQLRILSVQKTKTNEETKGISEKESKGIDKSGTGLFTVETSTKTLELTGGSRTELTKEIVGDIKDRIKLEVTSPEKMDIYIEDEELGGFVLSLNKREEEVTVTLRLMSGGGSSTKIEEVMMQVKEELSEQGIEINIELTKDEQEEKSDTKEKENPYKRVNKENEENEKVDFETLLNEIVGGND